MYPKKSEANYDFQELFLNFLLNNRTCTSYVKSVKVTEKDKKKRRYTMKKNPILIR